MNEKIGEKSFKRNTAYKFRIGSITSGKPLLEGENHLKHVEIDHKEVMRVNVIANIVEKYIQDGEKKFGSLTIDDGTGQLRVKTFGEDTDQLANYNQGDTVLIIGMLRFWKDELYITPEIIKKKEPSFLLLRKLEVEADQPKTLQKEELAALKDKIMAMIRDSEKDGGVDIEKIILDLKEPPEIINKEIKQILEDGVIYEPRPGKLRYLG